ncbi:hypothetical protein HW532_12140 [Kaustia mangrovi]|uniref:YCII-related domain-containing protein n=1 Tax=Kaustia mangrovi TaxID=2593653 RepID=A0A7S8C4S3_9HYPH|nr:YciI family protein [Kaustia mangrovi]QPC43376.1 hypothetical protein HW532_12140 [Kaustia mangrovi]
MFMCLLRMSENRASAGALMEGHKAWIQKGVEDGVFLLVGSLRPDAGGAILAHGLSRAELERRVNEDPFVAENVVRAEILEIAPARTDERLGFLMG